MGNGAFTAGLRMIAPAVLALVSQALVYGGGIGPGTTPNGSGFAQTCDGITSIFNGISVTEAWNGGPPSICSTQTATVASTGNSYSGTHWATRIQ
jgi:hypothetical protein